MDAKVENLMRATLEAYQALFFNFKDCGRIYAEDKSIKDFLETYSRVRKVCSDISVILRLTGEVYHGLFKTLLFDAQRLADEVELRIQTEKFYAPAEAGITAAQSFQDKARQSERGVTNV